mmetsp:Transcript_59368/g.127967  ORF Transcript_59368/g.127967 Transcript_59368/m.127967 type:complete len:258 (+) Transcript_59368:239-1012(+)
MAQHSRHGQYGGWVPVWWSSALQALRREAWTAPRYLLPAHSRRHPHLSACCPAHASALPERETVHPCRSSLGWGTCSGPRTRRCSYPKGLGLPSTLAWNRNPPRDLEELAGHQGQQSAPPQSSAVRSPVAEEWPAPADQPPAEAAVAAWPLASARLPRPCAPSTSSSPAPGKPPSDFWTPVERALSPARPLVLTPLLLGPRLDWCASVQRVPLRPPALVPLPFGLLLGCWSLGEQAPPPLQPPGPWPPLSARPPLQR